ncbi:DUF3107 domain-containing protein [Klugiella xanthotipulae]|uniref:Uncharacterized protein DUF3107 n=1 Tax=Klugiella xanthotipulae TaxID=244735 RepID=A0A543HRS0_9MICO|nr:DUF3107 domain-containing protein [Klugiella xanthotipulae]TQM61028.1 uncharacterized protein DUF3107 [Klugiella xanthotipulae]
MDIRIGIINAPREISFETNETAAQVEETITTALSAGSALLRLIDSKGKVFLIPTATIAYVELGSDTSRRVGFVG